MPRATKPPQLKALEGNPGRRKLADQTILVEGAPERPSHIQGYAATIWRRVIESMPPSLYTAVDSEILAAYCVACATHRRAVQEIDKHGEVAYSEKGSPYQNPWVSILNRQAEMIAKIGGQLGLDPVSRGKLAVPDKKPASKFTGLIGGRTG